MTQTEPVLLLDRIVDGAPARAPAGERLYAIGDIHGRLDLFEQLIAAIQRDNAARPAARVRLILLGDIIDRGPDSARLIERCMAFTAHSDDFVVLRGNHEAMMAHALRGNMAALSLWLRHGGDAALESWGVAAETIRDASSLDLVRAAREHVPPAVLDWIEARPLMLHAGDYLFVHAGIRPGTPLSEQSPDDLMWIRREFLDSREDHSCIIVHGHSINEAGVDRQANRIGIDTGAYRSNILTALALEDERQWILATSG